MPFNWYYLWLKIQIFADLLIFIQEEFDSSGLYNVYCLDSCLWFDFNDIKQEHLVLQTSERFGSARSLFLNIPS